MSMKICHPLHALRASLVLCLSLGAAVPRTHAAASESDNPTLGYIGTYTGVKSKGIYSFRLDSYGAMSRPTLVAETPNPTFLAVHPNQQYLYAANETGNFEGKKSGAVTAYAIDSKTGNLTLLNQ